MIDNLCSVVGIRRIDELKIKDIRKILVRRNSKDTLMKAFELWALGCMT